MFLTLKVIGASSSLVIVRRPSTERQGGKRINEKEQSHDINTLEIEGCRTSRDEHGELHDKRINLRAPAGEQTIHSLHQTTIV